RQHFGSVFPEYHAVPYPIVGTIYRELLKVVAPHNTPIARRTIEEAIHQHIPSELRTLVAPVRLYTAHVADNTDRKAIILHWETFFGEKDRQYPPVEKWNEGVIGALQNIKGFVLNNRQTRHIQLTGNRKLSGALAIGSVFSATSGFKVTMEYR